MAFVYMGELTMVHSVEDMGIETPRPPNVGSSAMKPRDTAISDETARALASAVNGLAEIVQRLASPPIIRADVKVDASELRSPGMPIFLGAVTSTREDELELALKEANGIIRSFSYVCARDGAETNWDALKRQVASILAKQHRIMYPEQYNTAPARYVPETEKEAGEAALAATLY